MEYSYKMTTRGRGILAACMALEKPIKITRVAFGAGKVEEDTNLADVHALLEFISDGELTQRRHENDRLYLTLQYANSQHEEISKMFLLSEFMIYTQDPESGEECDLLYGTLGDYRQPVPAYHPAFPPSVFCFPLVIVLSDEINVQVSAPAGLVTYADLAELIQTLATRSIDITIPQTGWTADSLGVYRYRLDVSLDGVKEKMAPVVTVLPTGENTALACGLSPAAETLDGAVRLRAVVPPEADIPAMLTLLRDSSGVVISGGNAGGGAVGKMPIATREVPGAVKPGPGLLIAADGTLSMDTATDAEVRDMLDKLDTLEEKEESEQ